MMSKNPTASATARMMIKLSSSSFPLLSLSFSVQQSVCYVDIYDSKDSSTPAVEKVRRQMPPFFGRAAFSVL